MKVSTKRIVASTIQLPAPFDKYYQIVPDSVIEEETGLPAHPSPVESLDGYDAKHLAYVEPREEYYDELADIGLADAEYVEEGGNRFIGYVAGDRLYSAGEREIANILQKPSDLLEGCEKIEAVSDNGIGYWYYTAHGLGPGMMPADVTLMDTYEEGYSTWVKLDRVLSTEELNYYSMIEEVPPAGSVTWNGDTIETVEEIEACGKIEAADDVDNEQLLEAFYDCDYDVIDAYYSSDDEIVVTLNHSTEDIDEVAAHLISCLTNNSNLEIADWNTNGSNVFIFKLLVNDIKASTDYSGTLIRFKNRFYGGEYLDSYDQSTLLRGICWCVGYDDDVEGYDWRSFSIKNWANVMHMSDVDIYNNYPAAPLASEQATTAATITKVAEDNDSIEYVIASDETEIEGSSLINYKNHRIFCDPTAGGWQVFTKEHDLLKSNLPSEKAARDYIDNDLDVAAATAIDLDSIDIDALKAEIIEGIREFFLSPRGGWPEDEVDQAIEDYTRVKVERLEGRFDEYYGELPPSIHVEVRAELSYEGMEELSDRLDPIVVQYDSDAYFDMVTGGVMEAFIYGPEPIDGSTNIEASYSNSGYDFDRALGEHERSWINGPQYDEAEVEAYYPDPLDIEFDFDFDIQVEEDTEWSPIEGQDPLYYVDDYSEQHIPDDRLLEDFLDLLVWHVPANAGKYNIKGKAMLEYDYDNAEDTYPLNNTRNSKVTDVVCTPIGKVESSTKIEAMTEKDLDLAIQEGKPFDLDSFIKYKIPEHEGALKGKDIEVGDVIDIQFDASEVNLGTVVKILAINDPAESWIDFTFRCEVLEGYGMQNIERGSIIELHFDANDEIGVLVPV